MTGRVVAVLSVLAAFVAEPALGALPDAACAPCCHQAADAPCEGDEAPCASLSATPCCDTAPASPAPPAKRTPETPSLHRTAALLPAGLASPPRLAAPRSAGDLALRASPLRLSVVLLI